MTVNDRVSVSNLLVDLEIVSVNDRVSTGIDHSFPTNIKKKVSVNDSVSVSNLLVDLEIVSVNDRVSAGSVTVVELTASSPVTVSVNDSVSEIEMPVVCKMKLSGLFSELYVVSIKAAESTLSITLNSSSVPSNSPVKS